MSSGFINPTTAPLDLRVASLESGMRNRVINGDMRIDQANAGAAVSVNAAAFFNSVDKFKGYGTPAAGVFSLQRLSGTSPNGFTNYLRATVTTSDAAPAAGSTYLIRHLIEGVYCQDLQFGIAGSTKSVALSFWVRSSLAGDFSGSLLNAGVTRSYPFSFNIAAANTWQLVAVIIPVETTGGWAVDTTAGVLVNFDFGCGANLRGAASAWNASNNDGVTGTTRLISTNGATFDLTGLQLEAGTAATTFEQRPFADMLRLCQREFCKSFNLATAPTTAAGINTGEDVWQAAVAAAGALGNRKLIQFPVSMRAAPVITTYNPVAANSQVRDQTAGADGSGIINAASERGNHLYTLGNAATAVGNMLAVHWSADARL